MSISQSSNESVINYYANLKNCPELLIKHLGNKINIDDIKLLFSNDPNIEYQCSDKVKSGEFKHLHHVVMLTQKYENLVNYLEEYLETHPADVVNEKGWTPLHLATRNYGINSRIETIRILLKAGANINAMTKTNLTPLMCAINNCTDCNEGIDVIKLLLDNGADVNMNIDKSMSALSVAIMLFKGKVSCDIIQLLLDYGADINCKTKSGKTMLHTLVSLAPELVVDENLLNFLHFLIKKGIDLDAITTNGSTALHLACMQGNNSFSIVKLLLDAGANTKIRDNHNNKPIGYTTQQIAAYYYRKKAHAYLTNLSDRDTVYLFSKKKLGSCYLNRCVALAAKYPIVNKYIEECLNVPAILKAASDDGKCIYPLHHAVVNIFPSCHAAEDAEDKTSFEIIKLLIKLGCDINEKNDEGMTPLMYLLTFYIEGCAETIKFLHSEGADLEITNNDGNTALFYAIKLSTNIRLSNIQTLLLLGANVNHINNSNLDILQFSILKTLSNLDLELFELLVKNGMNIKRINENGDTILHLMAKSNKDYKSIIESLFDPSSGFDFKVLNTEGFPAQHYFNSTVIRHFLSKKYDSLFDEITDAEIKFLFCSTSSSSVNLLGYMNSSSTHLQRCIMLSNKYRCLFEYISSIIITHDVDETDGAGWTALFYACYYCHSHSNSDIVKLLVDSGAKLFCESPKTMSSLILACHNTDKISTERTVEILLEAGKKAGCLEKLLSIECNNGWSPLMKSIKNNKGRIEIPLMLIAAGSNVNEKSSQGDYILHVVCQNNNIINDKILIALLEAGANINVVSMRGSYIGKTALHIACMNNYLNKIKILMIYGADTNIKDSNGFTADYYCSNIKKYIAINKLFDNGDIFKQKDDCEMCCEDKLNIYCEYGHSICKVCAIKIGSVKCKFCKNELGKKPKYINQDICSSMNIDAELDYIMAIVDNDSDTKMIDIDN